MGTFMKISLEKDKIKKGHVVTTTNGDSLDELVIFVQSTIIFPILRYKK